MSHHDFSASGCPRLDDAGAYALHALEDTEARVYADHLRTCSDCSLELVHMQLAVDTLPLAAPQLAPPEALKSRIMSVVNAESELLRSAGSQADRVPAAAPRRRRRWSLPTVALRPGLAGALACAVLAVGVVGGVVATGGSDGPATRIIPAYAKGAATAKLALTGDRAALEVTDLPSLAKGRVYQVWLDKGDGQLRPSRTLFNVRPDGRAKVGIDESVKGVKKILVTAEPSGGSLAPSPDGPLITAALA